MARESLMVINRHVSCTVSHIYWASNNEIQIISVWQEQIIPCQVPDSWLFKGGEGEKEEKSAVSILYWTLLKQVSIN